MLNLSSKLLVAMVAIVTVFTFQSSTVHARHTQQKLCPLQGNVQQDGVDDDAYLRKYVGIWFVSKWPIDPSTDTASPVFKACSELPKPETDRLCKRMNSSRVVKQNVTAWKSWYQKIFAHVRQMVNDHPPNLNNRFNIVVTVTSDKRISAYVEDDSAPGQHSNQMTPEQREEAQRFDYAHNLSKHLNTLDKKDILAFPAHSKASNIQFRLRETYPQRGLECLAINETIW